MTRFFSQIKRLGAALENAAGVEVTIYRRGAVVWSGRAFQGVTETEAISDAGVKTTSRVVDWLLRPSGLYIPMAEDVLVFSDGGRFIVRPVGSEFWRWSDAARDVLRVHTQEETPCG